MAGISSAAVPDTDHDTRTGRGTGDELDRALIQRDIEFAAEEWLYMESEFPVRAANMRRMAYHCRDLLRRLDAAAAENERWRGAYAEQRRMFAEWLNDMGYEQPDAWRDAESAARGGE